MCAECAEGFQLNTFTQECFEVAEEDEVEGCQEYSVVEGEPACAECEGDKQITTLGDACVEDDVPNCLRYEAPGVCSVCNYFAGSNGWNQ